MTEIVHPNGPDTGMAIYALGFYIQFVIDSGQPEHTMFPHMQAYLNLSARARGLEPPDLQELRARAVVVSQKVLEDLRDVSPTWLPIAEKYARLFPQDDSDQSTSDPDKPVEE